MSHKVKRVIALSIDYDGCGDILNDYIPDPLPEKGNEWPRVRPFPSLKRRQPSLHVRRKRVQFWNVLGRAMGGRRVVPDICMSGSARILYQSPLVREQDGVAHAIVLDEVLRSRGFPPLELKALHQKDGGIVPYSERGMPRVDELVRGKMTIIRDQVRLSRALRPEGQLHFVFIDDIYATKIARALRLHNTYRIVPDDVILHLIHYESFDPSTHVDVDALPLRIRPNVFYWPKE